MKQKLNYNKNPHSPKGFRDSVVLLLQIHRTPNVINFAILFKRDDSRGRVTKATYIRSSSTKWDCLNCKCAFLFFSPSLCHIIYICVGRQSDAFCQVLRKQIQKSYRRVFGLGRVFAGAMGETDWMECGSSDHIYIYKSI